MYVLMAAHSCREEISVPELVKALLYEGVREYRQLRDILPERLTTLLKCRCVLLYQCIDETLQFVAGASDEAPGWSAALLGAAHINPIALDAALPEACAWRERRLIAGPSLVALPLLYQQQPIGVLVALRQLAEAEARQGERCWHEDELPMLEAVAAIITQLLEHARLLEQDRARIDELSLLNRSASQLYGALHDPESLRQIIVRSVRQITAVDLCDVLFDAASLPAEAKTRNRPVGTDVACPHAGEFECTWRSGHATSVPTSRSDSQNVLGGENTWLTPALIGLLQQECARESEQEEAHLLLIERPGDLANPRSAELLAHLPEGIKTLFAMPLLHQPGRLLGMIVGASCRTRKLRPAEIMLLHTLAHQASAALSIYCLQEEKRRLDHLASLGEMAAGVAHEVRNPLAGIKYALQLLLQDLASVELQSACDDIQASVAVALEEIERLDGLVRELLSFAKPRPPRYTPCDLPALVERVLFLLQAQYEKAGIRIERTYDPLPPFQADILQIEQVLLNLLHNAIQAMGSGDTLSISCRTRAPSGEALGQWVELAISDTGCGIAREQLERIFQPFFTTRAHGIGLGLAITRRLIEDHGGRIGVESRVGHGTTFTVWLPVRAHDPYERG